MDYKITSQSDKGTLFQLRNIINHQNVTTMPKNSFDACEDFLNTAVDAHIYCCSALQKLKITAVSDDERSDVLHIVLPRQYLFICITGSWSKEYSFHC